MNNLARLRGKHGLTQDELGSKVGMTKAAVSYFEKNPFKVSTAKKFASALGESPIEVLGEDNLLIKPTSEEEKEYLINLIRGM